jgi:hypothetical protein
MGLNDKLSKLKNLSAESKLVEKEVDSERPKIDSENEITSNSENEITSNLEFDYLDIFKSIKYRYSSTIRISAENDDALKIFAMTSSLTKENIANNIIDNFFKQKEVVKMKKNAIKKLL